MLSLRIFVKNSVKANFPAVTAFHTSSVEWAARKGTREKAKKKKVKVEVKKVGFIPHNQRNKDKYGEISLNFPLFCNYIKHFSIAD